MSPRRFLLFFAAFVAIGAGVAWLLLVGLGGLPQWYGGPTGQDPPARASEAPATPGRKIKARLWYVGDSGMRLTSVERDVAFGDSTSEQARNIIEAQIAPTVEPLVSAIPPGTMLRALFVTDRGEAFVDFSHEIVAAHSGGSMNEALTVYTIVNVLTANLPAVTSVQLLVDGKQVETLAGHLDLRRPLEKNLAWVQ